MAQRTPTSRSSGRQRPGDGSAGSRRRVALLLAATIAVVLLAACGGAADAPGGSAAATPAAAASSSPSPLPSPQITSGAPPAAAVATVKEFWDLLGSGQDEQAFALTTADSPLRDGDFGLTSARFVKVAPGPVGRGPVSGATVEFAVIVHIEPAETAAGGQWTGARDYRLFQQVVRMSDGTWRLAASGTGP